MSNSVAQQVADYLLEALIVSPRRWRIVGHAGEVVEQSREIFATIAAALVSGAGRRQAIDVAPPTVARGWKRWMPRRERLSA